MSPAWPPIDTPVARPARNFLLNKSCSRGGRSLSLSRLSSTSYSQFKGACKKMTYQYSNLWLTVTKEAVGIDTILCNLFSAMGVAAFKTAARVKRLFEAHRFKIRISSRRQNWNDERISHDWPIPD